MSPQLRDRHGHAKRVVRGTARPDARGPGTSGMAGLARGRARRTVGAEGSSRALPIGGNDVLAGKHSGRKRQNNDASLIEPIGAASP